MVHLSVIIITLNEEKNISRCIDSVKKVADEIIVIDSFSTDRTKEIAIQKGAKVIANSFSGHIEQKNFGVAQSSFDYVLSMDADEELSDELAASILEIKKEWVFDGYEVNRLSSYCGQWIKHCGWYPDRKLRLFNKHKGKWSGTNPHDKYIIDDSKNIGYLKGDLLHYTFASIEEHIRQINFFSGIAAKMAFEKGKRSNLFLIIFNPWFKFLRDYVLKAGFLDGFYGFVICVNSAHAKFLKYVKLRQIQQQKLYPHKPASHESTSS